MRKASDLRYVLFIAWVFFSLNTISQVSFNTIKTTQIDSFPRFLVSADFNSDGKKDIAVNSYIFGKSHISVLLGNAQGDFSSVSSFSLATYPTSIVKGDFNGDGNADIAVSHYTLNALSVFLGNGLGNFAPAAFYPVGSATISALSSNDFNGDGKSDLALSLRESGIVSVLLSNPSGSLNAAIDFTTGYGPISITSGDFNGDGKIDIATSAYSSNSISVLAGDGTGNFSGPLNHLTGITPESLLSTDFNNDGKEDFATADGNYGLSTLLGTGTGNFSAPLVTTTGKVALFFTSADFDGDGKMDLATTNQMLNKISVYRGTGNGSFAVATDFTIASYGNNYLISDDFNGDGVMDIAVAALDRSAIIVLLNTSPVTGIKTLTKNEQKLISVFPNPTNSYLTIEAGAKIKLTFCDQIGNVVLENICEAGKSTLDIAQLEVGCYFLKVYSDKQTQIIKFIKN